MANAVPFPDQNPSNLNLEEQYDGGPRYVACPREPFIPIEDSQATTSYDPYTVPTQSTSMESASIMMPSLLIQRLNRVENGSSESDLTDSPSSGLIIQELAPFQQSTAKPQIEREEIRRNLGTSQPNARNQDPIPPVDTQKDMFEDEDTYQESYQPGGISQQGMLHMNDGRHNTNPADGGFRSTNPACGGIRSTNPADGGFRSTNPAGGGIRSTNPADGGFRSTNPAGGGIRSTNPADGGFRSTNPAGEGIRSTNPADGGFRSTNPPVEQFRCTNPADGGIRSTNPANGGIRSTIPVDGRNMGAIVPDGRNNENFQSVTQLPPSYQVALQGNRGLPAAGSQGYRSQPVGSQGNPRNMPSSQASLWPTDGNIFIQNQCLKTYKSHLFGSFPELCKNVSRVLKGPCKGNKYKSGRDVGRSTKRLRLFIGRK